ncbi:hypothetical protein BB561_003610 [Smittium simulii]|uniref:OPA3-like protein n=1 Tax=Smittium simulii TaxID=133385 RepID=A0A2T9YKD3_9FUNG|nr:hypothetical protein BB561_003610 [Smittium simulii]
MSTIKLATLFIKTLTKPVAKQLKGYAKTNKTFKNFCFKLAQTLHKAERSWKLQIRGFKPEAVRPLNEAKAVDNGAEFIGEAFIFSVAALIILLEAHRQRTVSKKEKKRLEDRLEYLESLPNEIIRLEQAIDMLAAEFKGSGADIIQIRSIAYNDIKPDSKNCENIV